MNTKRAVAHSQNHTENRAGHLVDGTVPPVVQPSESDLKK